MWGEGVCGGGGVCMRGRGCVYAGEGVVVWGEGVCGGRYVCVCVCVFVHACVCIHTAVNIMGVGDRKPTKHYPNLDHV